MFRIYSFASRSAVRRSQRPLQCLRPFHTSKARLKDDSLYSELLTDLQAEPNLTDKTTQKRASRTKSSKFQKTKSTVETEDAVEKTPKKRASRAKTSEPQNNKSTEETEKTVKKAKKAKTKNGQDEYEGVEKAKPKKARIRMTPEQLAKGKAERKELKALKLRQIPPMLQQNPWLDVTRYLKSGYGGSAGRTPLGDNKRIHVTSEALCNNVLERLEPTLEKHVGCDIIDINPGIGLWSSKLHDRLKPRTHIFLEPDVKLYRPFLRKLLEKPESKYRLVPNSGIVWGHLEQVLSKEYLPDQEPYKQGDPRLEQPNDTLLVIANVGYHPRKTYRGFDSLATLVLHQFMNAMRSHSLFQRYGHVRVMVWASDEERRHLIPMDIHQRRKSAVEAELSCENIQEIASSTKDARFAREKLLSLEKGREVLKKMEAAGIKTPEGRESLLLQEIAQQENSADDAESAAVYSFTKELDQMEADFAAGRFTTYKDGNTVDESHTFGRRGMQGKLVVTEEFKRLRYLRYRKRKFQEKDHKWIPIAEEFDGIIALQKEIHWGRQNGADTQAQELELQERTQLWKDDISERFPDGESLTQLQYWLDNRRTFNNNPPILVWDRRDFEPLRVYPDEFFPKQEMCLLDFHPRSLWPILRKDLHNYDILEFVLGTMFILPTQPLKKALNSLYPGAYDWISAECPSLRDPSKGGTLDLDMMSVRCITEQMLEEIVEAWVRWPFRPSRYELLSRMGSAGHDIHDVDR